MSEISSKLVGFDSRALILFLNDALPSATLELFDH